MIKLFVTDIDGTLTDGKFINLQKKVFGSQKDIIITHTHDCKGLSLLKNYGIKTMFLTSNKYRQSVQNRADSLSINYVYQGKDLKFPFLENFIYSNDIKWNEVAYIGDDINDYDCLRHAGYRACPADAVSSIKNISNIMVSNRRGGEGAIREFIDKIIDMIK